MDDADIAARERIATALGAITAGQPHAAAIGKLRSASKDKDQEVAAAAADAIKKVETGKSE